MKKTFDRGICLLLVLSFVLSVALIPNGWSVTAQAQTTVTNAAQNSLLPDNIQDGCTLQCWNWSLENIEANLGLIANMGYTSIQISPMQEAKEPTENRPYSNWWALYQPVSFYINEQQSHAIGTKDELISLCEEAHKYGIKVIMDVVCNHMANDGANILCSQIQQDILSDPHCWHDYSVNSWDYSSRHNITQYCMSGLPDLNTANAKVQNYCLELLKSYIDCGVDGFRFDGAKQIETPLDESSFASNFWPTVVNGATSYAKQSRNISLYCYGEILGGTDDNNSLPISAYTDYMSVTDSVWSNDVRYRINDKNAGGLQTSYFKNCNADKLVLWGESHDTYNDGSSSNISEDVINRAYALVASRAYAMSLYFPRSNDMTKQEMGQIGKRGWTSNVVKQANLFHNHFAGQSEYLTQDSVGNYYYNERGNSGIVIVNFNDGARSVDVPVYAMKSGTYVDQLTGNVFTVSNGRITGQMGDYGVAIVYNPGSVSCSHTSHGTDGYCFNCHAYVGHSNGTKCNVCSTEATRTFYFKNTESWSNVYAYCWHDLGTTVTDKWPGNKMTAVSGSNGYYSITVPATATNIIFNDGSGTQTMDLSAPAGENTFDYSTGFWSVYGQTGAPDYYYLHGYMNGEDYYGTDLTFVNGRLVTTFTQDSYVYVQDSNGVTYMTEGWVGEVTSTNLKNVEDITGEPNKLLVPGGVVVTLTLVENVDGTLKLSFVASETSCDHPYHSTAGICLSCGSTVSHSYVNDVCSCGKYAPGSKRTVYFKNTAKWTTPYLYAWNGSTEYTGEWPGTPMKLVDGETNIYELTIDGGAINVVFSNGAASRTNDLTLPTNGKNMFTVSSNSWSTYTPSGGGGAAKEYYLFGYINGADYGCNDDSDNLGEYKFVNNTLKVTFKSDSYVGIKTGDNQTWYMTHTYVSSTSGMFFNTTTGAAEKMLIPGGKEVTLTLKVNASGTLTLSYVVESSVTHNYSAQVTKAPGCTTTGVQTFTCSICGDTYTETIPATGHSYSGGSCVLCGEADPSVSTVDYYLFGYINGADYACNDDHANLGIYKFVNGKLTATFEIDSYVAIKEGNNQKWYMADQYISDTTGTFYDTEGGASEKMLVPGGVEVTFTLVKNGDGSLTLSYTTGAGECKHSYSSKVTAATCTAGGFTTYTCTLCGHSYTGNQTAAKGHSYSGGSCTVCGAKDPNASSDVDYYLFGYINGSNYACDDDYENLGIYKFVNGTLTTTFAEDSYVAIKEGNNQNWYMSNEYVQDTTGTFYNTADGASEKMFVPGGVEVTFTLVKNGDGSLTLSYTTGAGECKHSYSTKVTTATCTAGGFTTYTCTLCGYSYTGNQTAAKGHSYSGGSCTVCGAKDPNASTDVTYYMFGYINGSNYACEEDYENLGIYQFVGGKLTVTFAENSYVGVKTADNKIWYMTDGWMGEDTTSTVLYNAEKLGEEANKLYVPGNVEVTFTLVDNGDGTLTLSYSTASSECKHSYSSKVTTKPGCTSAGVKTYTCTLCGHSYTETVSATGHSYTSKVTAPTCTAGGFTTYTCSSCGHTYSGNQTAATGHSYSGGSCTVCGAKDPSGTSGVDYYLFGYINGSNYACEEDHQNLGVYKFVNGSLTVTFEIDSYIGVRTSDNRWYMTQYYVSGNGGVFHNTGTGASEKMFVPGGTEVTFTLTVNDDDTLNVQYTVENPCNHNYTSKITIAPSCSVHGIETFTCTLCGNHYTEQIPALGHNFVDGSCTVCGSKPVQTDYYLFGYIDGADYGFNDDYQNLGVYKFVDGSLKVTFAMDSYVGIKTGDNQNWYMTETYVDGTTGTFRIASETVAEKMLIPGRVEVTLTLVVNEDGTLTLSYTTAQGCDHKFKSVTSLTPDCITEGKRTHTCMLCGYSYVETLAATGHSYTNGKCTVCGTAQVQKDYYLFGYINGGNYGCEEDFETLGDYKFVNGKLTATFDSDCYVAVKTGDNKSWYMTHNYVTDTTATFYVTSKGTSEKMLIPGGVEVVFTLTVIDDESLTLSYTVNVACSHSYTVSSMVDADCDTDGEITYVCTKCGDSFTELIPSMGHDYSDGYCTECGQREPGAAVTPSLRLDHASLSFEDEIWYNMYFTASNLQDVKEMGLLIFDKALSNGGYQDAVQVISGYSYDGTYYMTHTDGVAAKNMGDAMYYRAYAKLSDGSYAYSENTVSYSAISYANSILRKSENSYMKALVVAMLNYGAEAQKYFGYRTDSLMNAGLTAEQQALAQVYGEDTMPNPGSVITSKNGIFTNTGFGKSSITASFDAAFAMNYYVNPGFTPDGNVTLYYWTEEAYASATKLTVANASGSVVMTPTGSGNQHCGTISGIAAKEMGKTIYAGAVYTSGGVTYSTVVMNYSMGKYCDTIAGRESSAQRELSMAAAVYGASARDYFDSL